MTPTPTVPRSPLVDRADDLIAWIGDRPWLAVVVGILTAAGTVLRSAVQRWRHHRLQRHAHQVTITPPPEVDPAGVHAWWANLAELLAPRPRRRILYGTPHVAMEYRWTGRQLTIAIWVPGTVPAGPVAAAVQAAWPAATATISRATTPIPTDTRVAVGGALAPAMPAWYPLNTDHDTDPLRPLIAAGTGLHANESACVQILARPATPRQVARLRHGATSLKTGRPAGHGVLDPTWLLRGILNVTEELFSTGRASSHHTRGHGPQPHGDPLRDRDARPALDKTIGPQWQVAIRYAAATNTTRTSGDGPSEATWRRVTTLAEGLAAAFGAHTGRNRLRRLKLANPLPVLAARPLYSGFLLSAAELATIAALPTDLAVAGLDRARAKCVPAPISVPTGGYGIKVLGRAEAGRHSVGLSVADARQHLQIIGSTGSGKSTELCHLALDDIRAGRGLVVIDPKGDLVTDILDRLPARLADRIVLIDPDQPDGARLNPLAGFDDDLTVDNVVSIFAKIFQRHWGPRIDDVLRMACLTIMRHANANLTLVPPLLNDKQFRAPYTVDLDDPEGLKGFWQWYETSPLALRAQVIAPVLARLRSFLTRGFVRRTIGTPHSSFDMGRVLDGGILLARLPKGQIGEETSKLMGSFVLASVWQAATARARIPEAQRRDASIIVDEAHNVLNLAGSVSDMLAEARGYHLSMVLAHQNLTQVPRDTQLAISANARNKIFFTCSPEDAHQLARHTLPELDEHDLTHLDAYTAAARLVVDNRQTAAFTMTTRPPRDPIGETTAIRQAVARPAPRKPTGTEQRTRRSTAGKPRNTQ
ncbi:MAG: type IV secretion system DNA-binding domain-containing protein [Dactylosporangium sp.]|nr:type IV secretion system DNA-binding domain-containing protein [Dactylosporangium sp.]NNJ60160.1 type IV secretion system DNA-binding domain-containing protein [Dactylosporangium sp.]